MRQRADDAGATLDIHSEPGAGTVVKLRIPLAHGPVERLRSINA
jgi:hypothetical protein